ALTAGGVLDVEAGAEVVCHRVLSLRPLAQAGGMGALSCGVERAEELLGELGRLERLGRPALAVSVVNHARQTVVSGPRADLEALQAHAGARGVSLTALKSRWPFHSSHLAPAVAEFESRIRGVRLGIARVPVFLPMAKRSYGPEVDLPAFLAAQLVRRLDFAAALRNVHEAGYRTFVEVGAGDVVTKLVTKNLANGSEERAVVAVAAAPVGEPVARGLARVAELVGSEDATPVASKPALAAAELGAVARLLRDAAERIERASKLLAPHEAGHRDAVEALAAA